MLLSCDTFLSYKGVLSKFNCSLIEANFCVMLNPSDSKLYFYGFSAGNVSNYFSVVIDLLVSIYFFFTSHSSKSAYFNIITLLLLPNYSVFSVIFRLVSKTLLSFIIANELIENSDYKIYTERNVFFLN